MRLVRLILILSKEFIISRHLWKWSIYAAYCTWIFFYELGIDITKYLLFPFIFLLYRTSIETMTNSAEHADSIDFFFCSLLLRMSKLSIFDQCLQEGDVHLPQTPMWQWAWSWLVPFPRSCRLQNANFMSTLLPVQYPCNRLVKWRTSYSGRR